MTPKVQLESMSPPLSLSAVTGETQTGAGIPSPSFVVILSGRKDLAFFSG